MSHSQHEYYRAPKQEHHLNLNDCLADCELASIKREKEMASMRVNGNGDIERFCDCDELIVNGERIPIPPFHNCEYVRARSALVPDAVDAALRMRGRFMKNYCALMERRAAPWLNGATDHTGG
jgi:hypothetical protein